MIKDEYFDDEESLEKFLDQIVLNVKKRRQLMGISQLKLSQLLNFNSPNYIAKIETRKHNVTYNLKHLYRLSHILKTEIIYLIPIFKVKD